MNVPGYPSSPGARRSVDRAGVTALCSVLVILVGIEVPAFAQSVDHGQTPTERGVESIPPRVGQWREFDADVSDSSDVRTSLLSYMEEKEGSILQSLRRMPVERYDVELVSGQRTLGQQARHVAEMNYAVCSALAGEAPPTPSAAHESPKKRLVDLVGNSFEYCRGVITQAGEDFLSGRFETPDGGSLPKAEMLFFLVGNWADHYGHFATYLRMSDLEPPETWSLPAQILRATTRR